ncbi:MAG: T9SS type A sorting domain-containing protein [Candidatus Sabulitectum sp.]|nr:T9SS type A sorting domain-containing protein [Candidatus Sabulitectum sp.]
MSTTGFTGSVQYSIYGIDGRLILQSSPVNSELPLNGSSYPAGVYTVVATGDGENASCKLVRL